jgi:hypothetical protein
MQRQLPSCEVLTVVIISMLFSVSGKHSVSILRAER